MITVTPVLVTLLQKKHSKRFIVFVAYLLLLVDEVPNKLRKICFKIIVASSPCNIFHSLLLASKIHTKATTYYNFPDVFPIVKFLFMWCVYRTCIRAHLYKTCVNSACIMPRHQFLTLVYISKILMFFFNSHLFLEQTTI